MLLIRIAKLQPILTPEDHPTTSIIAAPNSLSLLERYQWKLLIMEASQSTMLTICLVRHPLDKEDSIESVTVLSLLKLLCLSRKAYLLNSV